METQSKSKFYINAKAEDYEGNHFPNEVWEMKSRGSNNNVVPGLTTKSPFTKKDYQNQRPDTKLPTKYEDIILMGRNAYISKSVVRQVIDLQVDFITDGFDLSHPDKNTERFLNVFVKQSGMDVAIDEMARHLALDHVAIIRRITANLTKAAEKRWREMSSKADIKIKLDLTKSGKREIPVRYTFLDPVHLKWDDNPFSYMTNSRQLSYEIDLSKFNYLQKLDGKLQERCYKQLPPEVQNELKKSKNWSRRVSIPIDMEKVFIANLKKDSWQDWPVPALYSVLSDLMMKDKLRQADLSALDGVINVVRLWKLGDHTRDILPSPNAFARLREILESNVGGSSLDVIWDSMIDMEQYYPPTDKILGPEKYEQVDKDILIGLGVPEVLLGGKGANFSNSFIQLKTLVEKLKDVRKHVQKWIAGELEIVCEVLGIKTLPTINFEHMIMYDENVYRQLIMQMADRGIISTRTLLERFGENIEIETQRIKDESKDYDNGVEDNLIPKYSPFRSQEPEKDEDEGPVDTGGRPPNTKDTGNRNRKSSVRAKDLLSATKHVENVYNLVTKWFLDKNNIKNARKMTSNQKKELDGLIVSVLSCINSGDIDINSAWFNDQISNFKPNERFVEKYVIGLDELNCSTVAENKSLLSLILAESYNA